jgi:hypothetical protein
MLPRINNFYSFLGIAMLSLIPTCDGMKLVVSNDDRGATLETQGPVVLRILQVPLDNAVTQLGGDVVRAMYSSWLSGASIMYWPD